jgi:hypothetical protein
MPPSQERHGRYEAGCVPPLINLKKYIFINILVLMGWTRGAGNKRPAGAARPANFSGRRPPETIH